MKEFINLGFWFSIASISLNMSVAILVFIFGINSPFWEYFISYSSFLTPSLSFVLLFLCLFFAFLDKKARKQLLINSLFLLLGSFIPIILTFHIISSGY